ncbi:MAG: thiamine phosphate synthase [Gammaproteobacteria bacterium]
MPVTKPAAILRGLYVIADSSLAPAGTRLHEHVAAAIQGGARMVQLRDKQAVVDVAELQALVALCRQQQVPLLINDNIDLALQVGAAGVHLGQDDAQPAEARQRLGRDAIIGVTCHDQLALAHRAEAAGADYVAFGRFFPSQSKPAAPPADIAVLQQAHQSLHLPVVAIGGITPDNGAALIAAGADMLAVIHGVFGQTDVRAAARKFSQLFATQDPNP